jgi:hypothetical protein
MEGGVFYSGGINAELAPEWRGYGSDGAADPNHLNLIPPGGGVNAAPAQAERKADMRPQLDRWLGPNFLNRFFQLHRPLLRRRILIDTVRPVLILRNTRRKRAYSK